MRDFSKKRRSSVSALARLAVEVAGVALLMALVIVTTRAAWGMYQKFAMAAEERHIAQEELRELEEKEVHMQAAVAALASERGTEAELRSRFGVARPGEGEIKIVRDEASPEEGAEGQGGLWGWIVETFFVW